MGFFAASIEGNTEPPTHFGMDADKYVGKDLAGASELTTCVRLGALRTATPNWVAVATRNFQAEEEVLAQQLFKPSKALVEGEGMCSRPVVGGLFNIGVEETGGRGGDVGVAVRRDGWIKDGAAVFGGLRDGDRGMLAAQGIVRLMIEMARFNESAGARSAGVDVVVDETGGGRKR